VEWKIEERASSQETLVLKHEFAPGKQIEIRVLHDVLSNRYILRIVKVSGLSPSEISLLSSIAANLGLSLDYSPADKQIYLVPSPVRHIFASFEELNLFAQDLVEALKVLTSFLGDIRSSLEILENLLNKSWLVEYSGGKIESARKTFYLEKFPSWIIVNISAGGSFETGKVRVVFSLFSKDPKALSQIIKKLLERGFRVLKDMRDLGFCELEQEMYSLGLTERVVNEVEKLIKDIGREI